MQVVGICRFSLVGRGDWKAYQGKSDAEAEAVARQQSRKLFTPERMNARLASFEQLTLASLRAQTDPDFRFIVLASDLMPQVYRDRLQAICDKVPQVVLRFFGVCTAKEAQKAVFRELRIQYRDVLQFRLDDDDALCGDFVALMKQHCQPKMADTPVFVASMTGVLYCVQGGNCDGVYHWPVEFMSAGAAIRHPSRSIYEFGHFSMGTRFPATIIPDRLGLVTHNGLNDTSLTPDRIKKHRMVRLDPDGVNAAIAAHFPFLTPRAKALAGLVPVADLAPDQTSPADVGPAAAPMAAPAYSGPRWLADLAASKNRKGFYISHDNFALQHTYRGSQTLYVSFDNLSSVRADTRLRDPWGYGFADSSGWSSLGALTFRPDWFRIDMFFDEMRRLADQGFFQKFRRVVFSGTSMGAYAACAFSSLAPGSTVIAFSPQSSLAEDLAGWDGRYPSGSAADWGGDFRDPAQELRHAGHAWIVYDPAVPEDRRHAERLAGANVSLLRARYSSHFTAQYLRQIGILSEFVRGCADGAMSEAQFYRLYRQGRHYRRYLGGLIERASGRGSPWVQRDLVQVLQNLNRPGLAMDLANMLAAA